MVKSPGGPSVKFLVNAGTHSPHCYTGSIEFFNEFLCTCFVYKVHTMEELKLTGNHLKGSRPILTFSSNFDNEPRWKLVKEIIMQVRGSLSVLVSRPSSSLQQSIFTLFLILSTHENFGVDD